jgi:hypothetical protein
MVSNKRSGGRGRFRCCLCPRYVLYEARTEVIIKENTSFNEGDLNLEDYQGNADKKR